MDGLFVYPKSKKVIGIGGMIVGLALMEPLPYYSFVDRTASSVNLFAFGVYALVGLGVFLYSLCVFLQNRGAFLHMDQERFIAKINLNTEINCRYSEIFFADYRGNFMSLSMKNGKRYGFFYLENARQICMALRLLILNEADCDAKALELEIEGLAASFKKKTLLLVGLVAVMFGAIGLAVALTDGRDVGQFTAADKLVLLIFAVFELAFLVATFVYADRLGKLNFPVKEKRKLLQKALLAEADAPAGRLLHTYIAPSLTEKLLLFGFPDSQQVYYCVQEINGKFEIETVYTSRIFSGVGDLEARLEGLIQLT